MSFDRLFEQFHQQAWFDYASVSLFFPEPAASIRTALYRFKKAGKLVELRRGLYTFADRYRKPSISAAAIAGILYAPSYLSGLWALSFHGCIPEKVVVYTSVTPRTTKRFENDWGLFVYRSLKQALFSGYRTEYIVGLPVRIATPEKALSDLWHLESGEWTEARMESMRFEPDTVSTDGLMRTVEAYGSARLRRAAGAWLRYAEDLREGRREL